MASSRYHTVISYCFKRPLHLYIIIYHKQYLISLSLSLLTIHIFDHNSINYQSMNDVKDMRREKISEAERCKKISHSWLSSTSWCHGEWSSHINNFYFLSAIFDNFIHSSLDWVRQQTEMAYWNLRNLSLLIFSIKCDKIS